MMIYWIFDKILFWTILSTSNDIDFLRCSILSFYHLLYSQLKVHVSFLRWVTQKELIKYIQILFCHIFFKKFNYSQCANLFSRRNHVLAKVHRNKKTTKERHSIIKYAWNEKLLHYISCCWINNVSKRYAAQFLRDIFSVFWLNYSF